ncbi:MAG: hypothetical protein ACRDNP_11175 [Gaiellaceae bacterium]
MRRTLACTHTSRVGLDRFARERLVCGRAVEALAHIEIRDAHVHVIEEPSLMKLH